MLTKSVSMGENNVYKSLPLNVGYIRIFKIEPGKADEELKGTLSVIPLYDSPCYEYEALSYVQSMGPTKSAGSYLL